MAARPGWAGAFIADSVEGESEILLRPIARQRDAMHHAPMPVVVVDRIVLRAAVVPQRERADAPAEAAGELGLHLVAEQVLQERRALLFGHAVEADGMGDVDVKRFAPGLRMGTYHRVHTNELFRFAPLLLDAVLPRAADVRFCGGVHRLEAREQALHAVGQGLIS